MPGVAYCRAPVEYGVPEAAAMDNLVVFLNRGTDPAGNKIGRRGWHNVAGLDIDSGIEPRRRESPEVVVDDRCEAAGAGRVQQFPAVFLAMFSYGQDPQFWGSSRIRSRIWLSPVRMPAAREDLHDCIANKHNRFVKRNLGSRVV